MSGEQSVVSTELLPPDPERIVEGLRDTGYEFTTAVADLIDNSIAAGATDIDVRLKMDFGGDVYVMVGDNGCGMNHAALLNAMRYGSKRRDDPSSLGKFGLGLKTASTAFCRKLSVISRPDGSSAPIKASWDLDHIAQRDRWELLLSVPPAPEVGLLEEIAAGGSGTLVVWEKVDRLFREYAKPDGAAAKKALKRLEEGLRFHVRMVFQRFLDATDERVGNVRIKINGVQVTPWDPFVRQEAGEPVAEKTMTVAIGDDQAAPFTIRAYVLPRKEEFSDNETFKDARLSNDMQGIYVYRENRLIHGPDWLGLFRKEPHLTLSRIELSFDHRLDDAFQVDIKKSRILLDHALHDWLEKFLQGPRRESEARYRKGVQATVTGTAALVHQPSNKAIHGKAGDMVSAKVSGVDGNTGDVTITNKNGTTKLKIRILEPEQAGQLHVQAADSLTDGMLWEPAFIEGNQAVRINTSHPYYHKVYVPNRLSGVTVQGLDSLLWAMCVAELGNVNDSNKRNFEEMRYEVSRSLRRLVEDLPDPDDAQSEDE
jgi:hypothetical protein